MLGSFLAWRVKPPRLYSCQKPVSLPVERLKVLPHLVAMVGGDLLSQQGIFGVLSILEQASTALELGRIGHRAAPLLVGSVERAVLPSGPPDPGLGCFQFDPNRLVQVAKLLLLFGSSPGLPQALLTGGVRPGLFLLRGSGAKVARRLLLSLRSR
jgi:hypothetical protein